MKKYKERIYGAVRKNKFTDVHLQGENLYECWICRGEFFLKINSLAVKKVHWIIAFEFALCYFSKVH